MEFQIRLNFRMFIKPREIIPYESYQNHYVKFLFESRNGQKSNQPIQIEGPL